MYSLTTLKEKWVKRRLQEKIPTFHWNVRKVVLQKHAVSWGKSCFSDTSVMTAVCWRPRLEGNVPACRDFKALTLQKGLQWLSKAEILRGDVVGVGDIQGPFQEGVVGEHI